MKNTQKHTQGPWRSNYPQITTQEGMALTVAVVLSREDNEARIDSAAKTREEAMANAQLIAAAPDLLAALRGMVCLYEVMHARNPYTDSRPLQALAAITKAEGVK